MKKIILLTSLFSVAIVACVFLLRDGLTYLFIALMALAILGAIRMNKSGVMKMTRWSKANPKKAQWLITGIQLFLMGLGIITGKNLKELGYQFSDVTTYVFGAILTIGFLSVPFWPKRNTIAIPKVVDRQRLAYLAISLSSLIMTAQVGNRIGDLYPKSFITYAIEKIDQSIFSDKVIDYFGYNQGSTEQIHQVQATQATASGLAVFVVNSGHGLKTIDQSVLPGNKTSPTTLNKSPTTKKEIRQSNKELRKNYRRAALAASSAGSGIAIFFLIILVCVGACLFLGGIGALSSGDIPLGILGIIVGPLLGWIAIKGIKDINNKKKKPIPSI
jgi:hypothetical protein